MVVVAGLDRPNLFLEAAHCPTEDYRWRRLLRAARRGRAARHRVRADPARPPRNSPSGSPTPATPAHAYHGGMAGGRARASGTRTFLADEVPIMVATTAFGMGIDKPNIRWVAHVALPDSPDSYLQEIGRAGRDGAPARALLLYRTEDVGAAAVLHRRRARPRRAARPGRRCCAPTARSPGRRCARRTGLGAAQARPAARAAGAGRRAPSRRRASRIARPRYAPPPDEAAALARRRGRAAADGAALAHRHDARVRARRRGCRGQALLGVLRRAPEPAVRALRQLRRRRRGDADDRRRSARSRCTARSGTRSGAPGMVLGYEDDRMTVLFDDVGYKTLSVPVVSRTGSAGGRAALTRLLPVLD